MKRTTVAILAFFAVQGFLPTAMADDNGDYVVLMNRYSGKEPYLVRYRCARGYEENKGKSGGIFVLESNGYVKCRGSIAYQAQGSEATEVFASTCGVSSLYLHVNLWGPGTNPHDSCASTSIGDSYEY